MKNKIALATAALVAGSSFSTAEIVINDFLSFEGFVDMSYSHWEGEFGNVDESDNSFAIDQVEISWLFDFDPVTAQIDLNYEGGDAPDDTIVEQAFATYHFDNGGSITAGRYASMLGFEAFEPTGLYQYSFAYRTPNDAGDFISAGVASSVIDSAFDDLASEVFDGLLAGTAAADLESTLADVFEAFGIEEFKDEDGEVIDAKTVDLAARDFVDAVEAAKAAYDNALAGGATDEEADAAAEAAYDAFALGFDLETTVADVFTGIVSAGINAATPLPGYFQGVKFAYETDNSFFALSLQDGLGNYADRLGGDADADGGGYGIEAAGSFNFDNGISWFAGLGYEEGDGYTTGATDSDKIVFDTYVTFETGAWIFAAELVYGETEETFAFGDVDTEALNMLIMANFAYSDAASVTGRISYIDFESDVSGFGDVTDGEQFQYTIAHGYAFTDNLFLVNEISYIDGEEDNFNADWDEVLFATELIFSF